MEKKTIIIQIDIPIKDSEFTLSLPKGFRVLSTGKNKKIFCLWASVDPDQDKVDTQFLLVKNNEMIVSKQKRQVVFVTTLQDGDFVGHLFRVVNEKQETEFFANLPEGTEVIKPEVKTEKKEEVIDEDRESTDK